MGSNPTLIIVVFFLFLFKIFVIFHNTDEILNVINLRSYFVITLFFNIYPWLSLSLITTTLTLKDIKITFYEIKNQKSKKNQKICLVLFLIHVRLSYMSEKWKVKKKKKLNNGTYEKIVTTTNDRLKKYDEGGWYDDDYLISP